MLNYFTILLILSFLGLEVQAQNIETSLQSNKINNRIFSDLSCTQQVNHRHTTYLNTWGSSHISDTKVTDSARVNGSFYAKDCIFNSLHVNGATSLKQVDANTVTINGALKVTNSTFQSLETRGSANLTNTTIKGSTQIQGVLNAQNCLLNELNVAGKIDLLNTYVEKNMELYSQEMKLDNVQAYAINIKNVSDSTSYDWLGWLFGGFWFGNSSKKCTQNLHLHGSTCINGTITFESNEGMIYVYDKTVQLLGIINGATIIKKF